MQRSVEPPRSVPETPARATFLWGRFLLWLPACVVEGAAIAWVSVVAQEYFAPLLIFPLLVGVGLGAITAGMTRVGQVGHRGTIALGLLLAILVTVVGQHYVRYRIDVSRTQTDAETFRKARQLFADLARGNAPVPPHSFLEYLRWQAARGRPLHVADYVAHDGLAWFTWAADGLLVLLAAVAVVLPAVRQPYCNHCRSWYRTIRSGRLSAESGRRLAGLAGAALPDHVAWVRYRLLDCSSGCGPTGLIVYWEDAEGESSAVRSWLSAADCSRVSALLNQAKPGESQTPPSASGSDSTCGESASPPTNETASP